MSEPKHDRAEGSDLIHDPRHPVFRDWVGLETGRQFRSRGMNALGWAALSALALDGAAASERKRGAAQASPWSLPDHAAKAKHVISLHMVGGPPQMDLYDYKP